MITCRALDTEPHCDPPRVAYRPFMFYGAQKPIYQELLQGDKTSARR